MSMDRTTREQNFVRLAEARTNKALKCIELIGNLSNHACYEYSQTQVDAIFGALQSAISTQKSKFKDSSMKKFRL